MKVLLLLVVLLASFSLPRSELSDWAGIYDDVSYDFIFVRSRVERAVCARSVRAHQFASFLSQASTVLTVVPSPLLNIEIRSEGRSVLEITSVQKK